MNNKNSKKTLLGEATSGDKLVIYKDETGYKVTPQSNFNKRITNQRLIQDLHDFSNPTEIIDYYVKWFGSDKDDFIVDGSLVESKNSETSSWNLSQDDQQKLKLYLDGLGPDAEVYEEDGKFFISDWYDVYGPFETVEDLMSDINYTLTQWGLSDNKKYESLSDDDDWNIFIKKHPDSNDTFDRKTFGKFFDKNGKLIPELKSEYLQLLSNKFEINESYKLNRDNRNQLKLGDKLYERGGKYFGQVSNMWSSGKSISVTITLPNKSHWYGVPMSDLYGLIVVSDEESNQMYESFDVKTAIVEDFAMKRYSDHSSDAQKKAGWWYFTTHGVQPGSIPKDLNVLEIRNGKNKKGTYGTFVRLDGILNTNELKEFDMVELVPTTDESLTEDTNKQSTLYHITYVIGSDKKEANDELSVLQKDYEESGVRFEIIEVDDGVWGIDFIGSLEDLKAVVDDFKPLGEFVDENGIQPLKEDTIEESLTEDANMKYAPLEDRKPYKVFAPGDRVIITNMDGWTSGGKEYIGKTGVIEDYNYIGTLKQFSVILDKPFYIHMGGIYGDVKIDSATVTQDNIDFYDDSLTEDTVKQNGKWVNKGKEGTHGKFKTKKEADAQRKAMFANGYKTEGVEKDLTLYSFTENYCPKTKALFVNAYSNLNSSDKRTAKNIYEQRVKQGDVNYINYIIESYKNINLLETASGNLLLCPHCVNKVTGEDGDDVFVDKRLYWDDYSDSVYDFTCDWCEKPSEELYKVSFTH